MDSRRRVNSDVGRLFEMSRTRIVFSTILAAALGALSGAVLLGLPSYFSKECGFIGCDRDWAPYFAMWGALFGVVPGACIGFVVSRFKLNAIARGIGGGAVSFAVLLIPFAKGLNPTSDDKVFVATFGWIPIGVIIGSTIALMNRRARLIAAQQIVGREAR